MFRGPFGASDPVSQTYLLGSVCLMMPQMVGHNSAKDVHYRFESTKKLTRWFSDLGVSCLKGITITHYIFRLFAVWCSVGHRFESRFKYCGWTNSCSSWDGYTVPYQLVPDFIHPHDWLPGNEFAFKWVPAAFSRSCPSTLAFGAFSPLHGSR